MFHDSVTELSFIGRTILTLGIVNASKVLKGSLSLNCEKVSLLTDLKTTLN